MKVKRRMHVGRNPCGRRPMTFEGRIVNAISNHISEKTYGARTLVSLRKSLKSLVDDDDFWKSMLMLKKATSKIGDFMGRYFG